MKQDQDILERQLWEERRSVHRKYEEKLKATKTKYLYLHYLKRPAYMVQSKYHWFHRFEARCRGW